MKKKNEEKEFRGYILDRLGNEGTKKVCKTRFYKTYKEAYDAAARLRIRKYGRGERYESGVEMLLQVIYQV